jgi:predicted XRE-type DNA-binding protein
MSDVQKFKSVWDALEDSPHEAANLRLRADLMRKITREIERHRWTQTKAASRCGVTQPRINDLLRGKVSKFSLDALINIATELGLKVTVLVETA